MSAVHGTVVKKKFEAVDVQPNFGQVLSMTQHLWSVFFLFTKELVSSKRTYHTMWDTLQELKLLRLIAKTNYYKAIEGLICVFYPHDDQRHRRQVAAACSNIFSTTAADNMLDANEIVQMLYVLTESTNFIVPRFLVNSWRFNEGYTS